MIKELLEDKIFLDNYEITIYSCNYFEKAFDDKNTIEKFETLGVKVINPISIYLKKKVFIMIF